MNFAHLRASYVLLVLVFRFTGRHRDSVSVAELRQQWPRYALRTRDLDHGLARLQARGILRPVQVAGSPHVRLTAEGGPVSRIVVRIIGMLLGAPRFTHRIVHRVVHTAPTAANGGRRMTDG